MLVDWHNTVTCDLRNHLVGQLIQAILPILQSTGVHDRGRQQHELVEYAKKVEGDIYEMANSRAEYYHLLEEKIYKIQQDLEEKRKNRHE